MERVNLWSSRIAILLAIIGGVYAAAGCTVVRYVDNDDDVVTGPPPRVIDMLVMMDMSRATANLTEDYSTILGGVMFALAENNVTVRHAALAPLHSRAGGAVPLLYGEDDADGEFFSFQEAVAFYTYDGGAEYLQDSAAAEGENLATLGGELDSRAVYHPTTADTSASAYFSEPADGFVVLYFSASPRRCSMNGTDCEIDGVSPADYFTQTDGEGVTWLNLPGGTSLPKEKVFHGAIVTAENVSYDEFYEVCAKYPNFPAAKLDVMQPSSEHAYFGPFVEEVKANGAPAHYTDLCEAMSRRMEPAVISLVAGIRAML